eukprot:2223625-Alexandrium_andersonii.AAC.1
MARRAFDNMSPELMPHALLDAGHHASLVRAVVVENSFCALAVEFEGVSAGSAPFNKCARQGGVESAYAWNCVVYMCLREL